MFRFFITALAIHCGFVSADPILDMNILKLATSVFSATMQESINRQGVFIRTKWNDGCLDSGCCNFIFRQVNFNENCPSWGWMKWSFNGPMLFAHKPFLHHCLTCENAEFNCTVGTSRCSGGKDQQWHLNMQLDQTTAQGDVMFTINNQMYPEQCVTIDPDSEYGGLVLLECGAPPTDRQLFYVTRDWFQAAISAQRQAKPDAEVRNSTRT